METDDLIQRLAQNVVPARQLPAPMARATLWLVVSLPYIVITVVGYQLAGFEVFLSPDARYLVQQLATLATAVTAGIAAFCSVVPGRDLRIAFLPLLPLSVWLGSLAGEWTGTWLQTGVAGLGLRVGWACLPASVLLGLAPGVVILDMLRRGAPIYPRTTVMLATLASAALGNLGLRLFNAGEVAAMAFVWHLVVIVIVSCLAWRFGPRILPWPLMPVQRETTTT